jgi:hypothetical protein
MRVEYLAGEYLIVPYHGGAGGARLALLQAGDIGVPPGAARVARCRVREVRGCALGTLSAGGAPALTGRDSSGAVPAAALTEGLANYALHVIHAVRTSVYFV